MTQAKTQLTFEEFLTYDDGTDTRYELVNGVLVEMGAENSLNLDIAFFLAVFFVQIGVPMSRIGIKNLIAVDSSKVTAREPDLTVHSEASKRAIRQEKQAFLQTNMPAPILLVEVVSPGEIDSDNYRRDYVDKRNEYAKRGVPEFWLIDPARSVVLVLSLVGRSYQAAEFRGDDRLESPTFTAIDLTAHQILTAGEDG